MGGEPELVIVAPTRDLGNGFQVRRALPSPRRRMVGPFIFFDQMGPVTFRSGDGIDVRPHPHIGLATVTYLFEGEVLHRDSLGSVQRILPGAVNWIHYLHAAYRPANAASTLQRAKGALIHHRDLAAERAALAEAPLIICNSRRTRDDVVQQIGVDASRTRVVYYGGDPVRFPHVTADERAAARARFGWAVERPLVAFVGALGDRRKAFDTVFDAWVRLCADPQWDADLVVVGSGAEQPVWARKAREHGCGDRIRFVGFRSDVPELLGAVDALVHPARYEAYGLSVREALCRGIPAMVSRSAGVAEEYPASLDDLLLTNPDDAMELVERLQRWRRNRDAFDAAIAVLGQRLRSRTWDRMAAEIVTRVDEMALVR